MNSNSKNLATLSNKTVDRYYIFKIEYSNKI